MGLLAVDICSEQRHGCVWSVQTMQVETKYLRLCQRAELGEQIDGWRVCWLGGWGRDRLFYYVMVSRVKKLKLNLVYGGVNHSHARRPYGRWSRNTDVEEGWCDNIEEEHRWREYERARIHFQSRRGGSSPRKGGGARIAKHRTGNYR